MKGFNIDVYTWEDILHIKQQSITFHNKEKTMNEKRRCSVKENQNKCQIKENSKIEEQYCCQGKEIKRQ